MCFLMANKKCSNLAIFKESGRTLQARSHELKKEVRMTSAN